MMAAVRYVASGARHNDISGRVIFVGQSVLSNVCEDFVEEVLE